MNDEPYDHEQDPDAFGDPTDTWYEAGRWVGFILMWLTLGALIALATIGLLDVTGAVR